MGTLNEITTRPQASITSTPILQFTTTLLHSSFSTAIMSGNSSVGNSTLYEAGDQRNYKDSEINTAERYKEGKPNSHLANDSKDQRSIANKLAREEKRQHESEPQDPETTMFQKDATLPARSHGNEPSKGAKIDQELKEEEEAELRRKGKGDALPGKK